MPENRNCPGRSYGPEVRCVNGMQPLRTHPVAHGAGRTNAVCGHSDWLIRSGSPNRPQIGHVASSVIDVGTPGGGWRMPGRRPRRRNRRTRSSGDPDGRSNRGQRTAPARLVQSERYFLGEWVFLCSCSSGEASVGRSQRPAESSPAPRRLVVISTFVAPISFLTVVKQHANRTSMSTTSKGSTSESEIREAIMNYDAPAITTAQVGREVGITRQGAEYRLTRMHSEYADLRTDKMEGSRIWWIESDSV